MLFVYGTPQDPDILSAVLGRPLDAAALQPATAPGFRTVAYPGRVYPALVPAADEAASGKIVTGLDALDLAVLDGFEGDEYYRGRIGITIGAQRDEADTYLPTATISARSPAWSLADWTVRHKPAVIGTESELANALRQRLSARLPG